jgi:hypothetical protein
MHEAGLAVANADALRAECVSSGNAGVRPRGHAGARVRVGGGHSRAEDFYWALRPHPAASAPDTPSDIDVEMVRPYVADP